MSVINRFALSSRIFFRRFSGGVCAAVPSFQNTRANRKKFPLDFGVFIIYNYKCCYLEGITAYI